MATEIIVKCEEGKLVLSPVGRFDFHLHRRFYEAYHEKLKDKETGEIEVDLAGVDFIDSSALSMLILLREKAFHFKKEVTLSNCHGMVQQIMDTANFSQLFKIFTQGHRKECH